MGQRRRKTRERRRRKTGARIEAERREAATGNRANLTRRKPPRVRIGAVLDIVVEICRAGEATVLGMAVPNEELAGRSVRFDVALMNRGMNACRATRLLCGEGFWEFGTAAVRQLFELVLNAEYVHAQPSRPETLRRYAKFGLLQRLQREIADLDYREESGREVDGQKRARIAAALESRFAEFRGPRGGWQQSWTGLSARALAEQSPARLRRSQYRILYPQWSEETHGTPGALLGSLFLSSDQFDEVVRSDDVRCAELVSTAITLLIELWDLLPEVPGPDPAAAYDWTTRLIQWAEANGAIGVSQAPAGNSEGV